MIPVTARLAVLAVGAHLLPALEVPLASPASTVIPVAGPVPAGGVVVSATVTIPPGAPADLGVGAWAGDRHGSWAGRPDGRLPPGTHAIRIDLGPGAPAHGPVGWGPAHAALTARAGLFFWSAQASTAVIRVDHLRVAPAAPAPAPRRVLDLAWPEQAATGQRWQATFQVDPVPTDPFDPAAVRADLVVTAPDGTTDRRPAFWDQPVLDRDRGDAEDVLAQGPGRYAVRWRPRVPGPHRLRLEVRLGERLLATDLPPVTVTGAPWDGYARIDGTDRRFLSLGGRFWWPVGVNLRSLNDLRSEERLATRPVPERGTRAYAALLDRFGAHGVDAAEVWLSSWNLALEWNPAWEGYGPPGRYHPGRAWQLDRLLDLAEARGQRLILVLHNHGQGSSNSDREWQVHPYHQANGGFLKDAAELFTDARAQALQARLRRYLVGRYGDSPAVLAWKLWSEVDLTDAARRRDWAGVAPWHAAAVADLRSLDGTGRPITTHFSGTWRRVRAEVADTPGLDLLTIDAYHGGADEAGGMTLSDLLAQSVTPRSLLRHGKAVWVTECGGSHVAAPEPLLTADHQLAPWVGLVTGMAGSPLFWWSQWIDQGSRFGPYRAISRFIAGEDLRGAEASSSVLRGEPADLWVRAWIRPGRLLGYALSRTWAVNGSQRALHEARIRVGEVVEPGAMALQWWNADTGEPGPITTFDHPGGPLVLDVPPAQRHIAFKLWRPTPTTP